MDILVISATKVEQKGLKKQLSSTYKVHQAYCGVGNLMTAANLSSLVLLNTYDLVIQIGLAGSFCKRKRKLGDVVFVRSEHPGDLYVYEKKKIKDAFDLDLISKNRKPFKNGLLTNPKTYKKLSHLEEVSGLSVNTIYDDALMNKKRRAKWRPDIESMEGAALHFVCLQHKIPFVQLRGISNFVGERDKSKWLISESIEANVASCATFINSI